MNLNPAKSISKLKQSVPADILFGKEIHENNSSEQFLLSMYDSVQASIFVVDVLEDGDFCYLALNPTHEQWVGMRSEELRGKRPEDILSPIDAVRVRQRYTDCVYFGKTISYEQCLQFKGISTWWSTTLTPLRDANSRIYRLIGTSRNITPSIQAEQTFTEQAEQQRLLESIAQRIHQCQDLDIILERTVTEIRQCLQSDRVLIYHSQPDGSGLIIAESTITANDSLLGKNIHDPCFNATNQERYRRGCIQAVEDIYAVGLHPCLRNFLESLQVKANLVVPILLQQDLWGLLIVQQCRQTRQWQQPEIELLKQMATQMGIAIQQTKLHQQIELQKRQAQDHKNFVSYITILLRDNLGTTQVLPLVTEELAKLLNLERCQIELYNQDYTLATVTWEYTTSLPRHQGLTRQIADFGKIYQPLLQKQPHQSLEIVPGSYAKLLIVSQLAVPIFDARSIWGNIWLIKSSQEAFAEWEIDLVQLLASQCAIALHQSQLYEITQTQQRELETRERLKNEFLKTLSQELRTSVTSISLAAQTLENIITIDAELASQLLEILQTECGRESKLINHLLTLTYLKTQPAPPTLITIDLETWLPPIVQSFRDLTSCQGQQLNLEIGTGLPPLETDITDLERIVTELLNHACKCTPPGESIRVAATRKADIVQISFTNSGVEMNSQELLQIFQPFYRLAKNEPWKSSETGLELAIVQTMVQHLGGLIHAESTANQITFTLEFPL